MIHYVRIVTVITMFGLGGCAATPATLRSCSPMSQTASSTGRQCLAMAVSKELAVEEWVATHGNPDYISIRSCVHDPAAIAQIVMLYLDRDLQAILAKDGEHPDRVLANRGIDDNHLWGVDRRHRQRVEAARERRLGRTARDVTERVLLEDEQTALATLSQPPYEIQNLWMSMMRQSVSNPRGEFETVDEFEARRTRVDEHRVYHFVLDPSRFDVRYGIDDRQMTVSLPIRERPAFLSSQRPPIGGHAILLAEDVTTDTVSGTTGSGVRLQYQSRRATEYHILINNATEFAAFNALTLAPGQGGRTSGRLMFQLPMDVETARDRRQHIGLLIGVSFRDPPRFDDSLTASRATLDRPVESVIRREYVVCVLRFAIVYDTRTQAPLKTYVFAPSGE